MVMNIQEQVKVSESTCQKVRLFIFFIFKKGFGGKPGQMNRQQYV